MISSPRLKRLIISHPCKYITSIIQFNGGIFSLVVMVITLLVISAIANLYMILKAGGWNTYLIYNEDFYSSAVDAVCINIFFTYFKSFMHFDENYLYYLTTYLNTLTLEISMQT